MALPWQKLNNFQQRAIFGTIGIIVVFGTILLSHSYPFEYLFISLLALSQAIALWEFYHLAKAKGFMPMTSLGVGFSSAFIILRFFALKFPELTIFSELLLYPFAITVFLAAFRRHEAAIVNLAVTFFGFLYITLPLSLLLDINYSLTSHTIQQSSFWLIFLLSVTKITDVFAYFTGKKFGTKQIAPILSPKKTVEGTIGGLIGALLTGMVFYFFMHTLPEPVIPSISFTEMALLGVTLGAIGTIGDLAESLFKRDARVKDSNSLPGFGGMLDIVDSVLFTAPLLYIYLRAKILL